MNEMKNDVNNLMGNNKENAIDLNVTFKYKGEKEESLSKIEGNIEKGKCVCLCGASGCGKTTLIRSINHLIPDFYEGNLTGYVHINNEDIKDKGIGEISEFASSVFQDPRSQFFTVNSTTEVAFGLENTGVDNVEIKKRTDEAFEKYGLEKLRDRKVSRLSSGERQLVAIISALALDTDIILLDEPTANLDAAAIEQIKELLKKIKRSGKTIVINEHRLYFLKDIADQYWYIKDGRVLNKFSSEEMLNMTEGDLDALGLRKIDLSNIEISRREVIREENHTLELKNIKYGYNRKTEILSDISLSASTGEVIGIIGSNGSGKTTLGKNICGLVKKNDGEIIFDGIKQDKNNIVKNSLFIMQEAEFQFFSNTVWNEIKYGNDNTQEFREKTTKLLKKLDMWECRNRHPFSLSGGQMQKLTLILAYFSKKKVIVLDEPTAGLDYKSLLAVIDMINEMQKNKIVFIITHDLELISKACTKCISIANGKISDEFDLDDEKDQMDLREYMKTSFSIKDNERNTEKVRINRNTDIRTYMFYLLVAFAVGITGKQYLITPAMLIMSVIAINNKQYRQAFLYPAAYAALVALPYISTNLPLNLIANMMMRFMAMTFAADITFSSDGASLVIAGLRKIKVPEKIIIIAAVSFRFFPVVISDAKISNQAIKTRSFFKGSIEKIKRLPAYVEIMIVPMIFRMLRIAEYLSASAETRGITLKCRKNSYIDLKMNIKDYVFIFMYPLFITGYIKFFM
ncbi:MAG: ATP-binding cassette domain-containing protein [Lachnospiraceae bacterium]|nr:ATP-binding cassette domain-containing protein [Lachnospiraceae bacterium]